MSNHLVGVAEIADMLAVSRQRVAQLMETYTDFPKPEVELTAGRVWARSAIDAWMAMHPERKRGEASSTGGMFERFTDRARRSIVLAQEEARLLNHNYIGTEHELLGLIHEGEGLAAKAVASLGYTLEDARKDVETMIGRGTAQPQGHIPFTPRAKKTLELSLGEAMTLGHNYISTEHILLGILREGEGVAAQMLIKRGHEMEKVRKAVLQMMHGAPDPQPKVQEENLSALLNPIVERLDRIEKRLREAD